MLFLYMATMLVFCPIAMFILFILLPRRPVPVRLNLLVMSLLLALLLGAAMCARCVGLGAPSPAVERVRSAQSSTTSPRR